MGPLVRLYIIHYIYGSYDCWKFPSDDPKAKAKPSPTAWDCHLIRVKRIFVPVKKGVYSKRKEDERDTAILRETLEDFAIIFHRGDNFIEFLFAFKCTNLCFFLHCFVNGSYNQQNYSISLVFLEIFIEHQPTGILYSHKWSFQIARK